MNTLKVIDTEVKGEVVINLNTQYNNLKADQVTVTENVTARIYGTIEGNVILKKGSRLHLHGVIRGKAINEGGEVYLYK